MTTATIPANYIVLRCPLSGWTAEYFGSERQKIIDLFGTAQIPTAFGTRAMPSEVMTAIARLNPGYEIRVGR